MSKPCIPDTLPIENLDWRKLLSLTSKANAEVARFDGALEGMVNPELLLTLLTLQEAVLSSRIEGTQATLTDVLRFEAGDTSFSEKKTEDIQEVINYRKALKTGVDYLQERTLSLSLIKELHKLLMQGVRGQDKLPGQFRTTQNWIGPKGSSIDNARFVPPEPLIMQSSLDNIEQFIQCNYDDVLIQLAIIHAQFEIIHPFLDGNGRLGRMLVTLFLNEKKIIRRPVFYLSAYLDDHSEEYRDRLLNITKNNDWQGWIEFFLHAVTEQAIKNMRKAVLIHELYERMKIAFQKVTHSQYAVQALDAFFISPYIQTPEFIRISGLVASRTSHLLSKLKQSGLILCVEKASGQKPATYVLTELINVAEGREVYPLNKNNAQDSIPYVKD